MSVTYSFALIVTDWDRCIETVNSIRANADWEQYAELFLLDEAGIGIPNEMKELETQFSKNIYIISDGNPVKAFLSRAAGQYITYVPVGVLYCDTLFGELNEYLQEHACCRESTYGVAMLADAEKKNYEMTQFLNGVVRDDFGNGISFAEMKGTPHVVLSGYFVKKSCYDGVVTEFSNTFLAASLAMMQALVKCPGLGVYVRKPLWRDCNSNEHGYFRMNLAAFAGEADELNRMLDIVEWVIAHGDKGVHHTALYYCSSMMNTSISLFEHVPGEEQEVFLYRIFHIVNGLNDSFVLDSKLIPAYIKHYLMKEKYGGLKQADFCSNRIFLLDGKRVANIGNAYTLVQFVRLDDKKNQITIEGVTRFYQNADEFYDVYLEVNGEKYPCMNLGYDVAMKWMGKTVYDGLAFRITVPLDPKVERYTMNLWLRDGDMWIQKTAVHVGKYAPVAGGYENSYVRRGIWTLKKTDTGFTIRNHSLIKEHDEWNFVRELLHKNGKAAIKPLAARELYRFTSKFGRKKVWLVQDRINRGDDNGEAFFKYLMNNKMLLKKQGIQPIFVIDKNTGEYKRLSKLGKVISTLSGRHRWNFLRSEYIISSQGNNPVVAPFSKTADYYKDILCDKQFIFLQHGVTKDNQARWLNKYNRNIFGLIVSTGPEYDSMLEYEYYYEPERIWLTGMPRYDLLYHDEKKYITFMPTWRKSLMKGADPRTGIWILDDGFTSSSYYHFYNSLFNDKRLLEAAKKLGYTICFMPHPNMAPYVDVFQKNPQVLFFDETKTYRELFAETDLLVTDYSSVAFDFAYLNKPIVYAQFDADEFFSGAHSYTEGYFDYERDGFGEITRSLDETVELLIQYMEQGCGLKPEYRRRIQDTFAFQDKKCCERVMGELLALRERNSR